jgi:hypothetical protein
MCVSSRRQYIVVRSLHARTSDNNNINKPPFIPVAEVPSYRPTDGHIHYSFVYYTHTHTLVLPIHSIIIVIIIIIIIITRRRYVHDMWQRYMHSYTCIRRRVCVSRREPAKCRMRHPISRLPAPAVIDRCVINLIITVLYDTRTNSIRKMRFLEIVIISCNM